MQFDYLVLIKNYNPQDNFLINPETMKFGLKFMKKIEHICFYQSIPNPAFPLTPPELVFCP